jgi:lysophospholipase L1-like esterase
MAQYGATSYENHAVGGAKLADIASQLDTIQPAPGPALVMLYIGGNDLSPFIFQSDAQAMAAWAMIEPNLVSTYDGVFAKLANTTTFPDGAVLLMNTQYNPFDDCTASPYNLSATKIGILHMFNDKVKSIADAHGAAAIVVDQHTPFLGHGHHFDVMTCPHYMAGAVAWMQDTIHANPAGNVDLAAVMEGGADRLYRDCIP